MNRKVLEKQSLDDLFIGVLTLKNVDECYKFFGDLFTPNELHKLSQRFSIAKEFYNGESFTNVNIKSTASSATIAQVKRNLVYGNDGLILVLDRIYNK